MKTRESKLISALAVACLLVISGAFSGCYYPPGDDILIEDTILTDPNPHCGGDHQMPGRAQIFQYEYCGSTDTIHITQDTLDTSTGVPLGEKSAGRGVLSFTYTDLDNNQFFNRENFGIFFEAEGTKDMTASWRLTSQSLGDGSGDIMTSLITQLQGPGCWDNCYYRHDSVVMQFYDMAEVFQFDCSWSEDLNRSKVRCNVTKPSDPNYNVIFWSHMLDRYVSLIFLGVGKNAYPGDYPSYQATVSDFKLTLFE